MEILTNINIIFYITAYLVGGIPFGWMICKLFYGINVCKVGSKSIGATNVYRVLKSNNVKIAKFIAIATLLFDALKGMVVIIFAKVLGVGYDTQWMIAILAILGHCYSPFLRFSGGKGVSTTIGSTILLIPIEGICGLIVWFLVGKFLKISSLSSLLGVLSGILLTFIIPHIFKLPDSINVIAQINTHAPLIVIGAIVIYTHIPNIKRIISGQENKVL